MKLEKFIRAKEILEQIANHKTSILLYKKIYKVVFLTLNEANRTRELQTQIGAIIPYHDYEQQPERRTLDALEDTDGKLEKEIVLIIAKQIEREEFAIMELEKEFSELQAE